MLKQLKILWLCTAMLTVCATVESLPYEEGISALKNGTFTEGADGLEGWRVRGGDLGSFQVVKDEASKGEGVLKISVDSSSSRPWAMTVSQRMVEQIPAGFVVIFSFDYRLSKGYRFQLLWQQERGPREELLTLRVSSPEEEWKTAKVMVPVHVNLHSGESTLSFLLAETTGQLELRRLSARVVPDNWKLKGVQSSVGVIVNGDEDEQDWQKTVRMRLKQVRMVPLHVRMAHGEEPVRDATVTIQQTASDFEVGVTCRASLLTPSEQSQDEAKRPPSDRLKGRTDVWKAYRDVVFDKSLFRLVLFTDMFCWNEYETWGKQSADLVLELAAAAGMDVQGHAMFNPSFEAAPQECRGLSREALKQRVLNHVRDLSRQYRDRIDRWTVVHDGSQSNDIYSKIGIDCLRQSFGIVEKETPQSRRMLSDRESLTSRSDIPMMDMVELVVWLETHMHVRLDGLVLWGAFSKISGSPQNMERRLDYISQILPDVPIYIAGLSVRESDDALQAEQLKRLLTLCYSHPAVAGVLLGELWEPAADVPSMAYCREDFSPRQSLEIVRKLLTEEWRTTHEETMRDGEISLLAFAGTYDITVSCGDVRRTVTVKVPPLGGRSGDTVTLHEQGATIVHEAEKTTVTLDR